MSRIHCLSFQSVFRLGCGTDTALTARVDDWRQYLDRTNAILLLLLGPSAAFDTIVLGVLLRHLLEA